MGRLVPALWPLVIVLLFAFLVACGTVEAVQEVSDEVSNQEKVVQTDSVSRSNSATEPAQGEIVASLFAPAIPHDLLVDTPAALNVSQTIPNSASEQSAMDTPNATLQTAQPQQALITQQSGSMARTAYIGNIPTQPASVMLAPTTSLSAPVSAPVSAPPKMGGVSKVANEGDIVTFEGTFSDPGVLDTHTIRWNFGDGTETSNVLDPTHVYKDNGTYKVTLDVTDKDGDIGSANIDVLIRNLPPVADLGPARLISEGVLTTFDSSITDPGANDTHSFLWDFGAGGTLVDGGRKMTRQYPDEGIFVVTLTVTDDDGGATTVKTTVHVLNESPAVNAGSDQTVDEGTPIQFAGSFLDPGALDTHSITWNFGDGTVSTGTLSPTHVYKDDGTFTATLIVTDNDGGTGTDKMTVKVLNKPPTVQISR